ncbi:MAG: protein translocase subunit SecD [Planctomycetota bacterium]|nr:protein translocase subunit SecD [Planctomycetota bacterium]
MVENAGRKVVLIVALIIASIALLAYKPLTTGRAPFPLGLDIAGGERLLYRIDLDQATKEGLITGTGDAADLMQQTIAVIRQRCDNSGNTEAVIRRLGTDRIEVNLPRVSSTRTGLVTAKLAAAISADGLPIVRIDGSQKLLDSFPGSGGTLKIDSERLEYSLRVGNELTLKERGVDSSVADHAAGSTVTLIDGDSIRTALENLGDMRFLAAAQDEDIRRTGTDLLSAEQKLRDWLRKPENTKASIDGYNQLAQEAGGPPRGMEWYPYKIQQGEAAPAMADRRFLLVKKAASTEETFTGANLLRVGPGQDKAGYPAIEFTMNDSDGTAFRFGRFTEKLVDKQLAIVMNDEIITAPTINSPLFGNAIIEGRFGLAERDAMVTVLRSGSLKIKPELESSETVGASIGDDYVRKNLWAGVTTLAIIIGFLLVYYRRLGMWASAVLLLNLLLLMGGMVLLNGTLTLAGIGGIVLTVGMAVDASILIFERIREEQAKGRKPMQAAKDGFDHAMSAIVDGNLTTLITAFILMYVGTGTIRGFAVTLTIGIITTMFCALVALRVCVHFELKRGVQAFEMREFFRNANFKFMSYRKPALLGTAALLVAGVALFAWLPNQRKYGIDFLGGATVKVRTEQPISADALRARVEALGGAMATAEVVDMPGSRDGQGNAREFRITFKSNPDTAKAKGSELENQFKQEIADGLDDLLQKGPIEIKVSGDTASGTLYFEGSHSNADVQAQLANAGFTNGTATSREGQSNVFAVQGNVAGGTEPETLLSALATAFEGQSDTAGREYKLALPIPESSVVGAQVVGELRDSAIKALAISSLLILLYIRVRFAEYSYGWAALLADLHDVVATLAAIAFLVWIPWIKVEMNLTMIAAFLTILGYSLNDTIVVFDRIRENRPRVKGSLLEVCDLSINQTLSRTVITSGTTILSSLVILIFNFGTGNALEGFAFALTFGVVAGTFSSIYIASPLLVYLEARAEKKAKAAGQHPSAPKPQPAVEDTV